MNVLFSVLTIFTLSFWKGVIAGSIIGAILLVLVLRKNPTLAGRLTGGAEKLKQALDALKK